MLASSDVEFISVPRTGDVRLSLGEREAQARLVVRDQLLHTRDDLALADGTSHVRADILEGGEFAVATEHAHLGAIDLDDLAAWIGESCCLANDHVRHPASSLKPNYDRPPRRYHIAKSNRLM